MIQLNNMNIDAFLSNYWQKKPLVIRQALPNFINPITIDELAGLALEEDIESRIVFETPHIAPFWHLKTGPFQEADFKSLPKTHWTILVQGVDRIVPEVMMLLNHFDFIPQWRIDDVMISYAVNQGSVGPHYDNYDVFLYQAMGRRKWSLTSQNCSQENYLANVDLRIMDQFDVEETFMLEEGDMLYLPPHIGHHGVSQSSDCMTYSFGYRSYQSQELWNSFGDYLSETTKSTLLYQDPIWTNLRNTSEIPETAWSQARQLMQQMLANEQMLKSWFGAFVTQLDMQSEQQLPVPLNDDECADLASFLQELVQKIELQRDGTCRMAIMDNGNCLFINGSEWNITGVSQQLIQYVANNRLLKTTMITPFLDIKDNQLFLYELWKAQWLQFIDS